MRAHAPANHLTVCRLAVSALAGVAALFACIQPAAAYIGVCVVNCNMPPPPPPPPPPPVYHSNGGGGGGGSTYVRSGPPRLSPSGQVNNRGNALFDKGDYDGAVRMYLEALRLNPANNVARSNLANARARVAWKRNDFVQAIAYQREACRLSPGASFCAPVSSYEALLAKQRGDYARALAKFQEAYRRRPSPGHRRDIEIMERQIAAQRRSQQQQAARAPQSGNPTYPDFSVPGTGARENAPNATTAPHGTQATGAGQPPSCPFDRCGNPGQPDIDTASISNPSPAPRGAGEQLTGIKSDVEAIRPGDSAESAHRSIGCGFDGRGDCQPGSALPTVTPAKLSTKSAVFPNVSAQDWQKLQNSPAGAALIKRADELLDEQDKLKTAIREIRFSANAAQRQDELIKTVEKLDKVNEKLNGLQKEAKKIVVVLD